MSWTVIRETVRRHYTSAFMLVLLAFLGIVALASSRFDTAGAMWTSLMALLSLGVGGGLIGPEFSSGTLQLILVKPINRSAYLISRVTGAVLVLWIAIAFCAGVETIGRLMWGDSGKLPDLGRVVLNAGVESVFVCAILAFFGTMLRAYFNVALYFLLQIGMGMTIGVLNILKVAKDGFAGRLGDFIMRHPGITESVQWVERNLFPDAPPRFDRDWTLLVFTNAAIAVVLACLIFRKREVPYGAD